MPTMLAIPHRTNEIAYTGAVGVVGVLQTVAFDITAFLADIRKSIGFADRLDVEVVALGAGITAAENPQLINNAQGVPITLTVDVTAAAPGDQIMVLAKHNHSFVA